MNIFQMMKQAGAIQKEVKGLQRELAGKKVDVSRGGVRVVARADMYIESIKIEPAVIDSRDSDRIEKAVLLAVNDALGAAKDGAVSEVSKIAGGLGLGDMLRGMKDGG